MPIRGRYPPSVGRTGFGQAGRVAVTVMPGQRIDPGRQIDSATTCYATLTDYRKIPGELQSWGGGLLNAT